ncbi:Amino acid permease [Salipiger thiooxidans]|uniref:Amino acid permease n=1 Tax=Salipiger thiooxidans TaxID=282683 RepID=A0A1G7ABF5_9RHOB|nr:Amino acid permease [Salipiger thiooxidans]
MAASLRYSKFLAPLSVWWNRFAWTPVLSLGCAIAACYVLNAVAPMPVFTPGAPEVLVWLGSAANAQAIQGLSDGAAAQAAIAALTEANTPFLQSFSVLRFSLLGLADIDAGAAFFIGAALMLITFAIQHRGILGTARVQMWIGLMVVVPMLIVGIVPFFNGNVNGDNSVPLVPPPGE